MTVLPKCYGWKGTDGLNNKVAFLGCAGNPDWTINSIYGTTYYFPSDDGVNITGNSGYGAKPVSIISLNNQSDIDAWKIGYSIISGDCRKCPIFTPKPPDCPPGTCKCASSVYPGYCCLNCDAIGANLSAITNELKGKNG